MIPEQYEQKVIQQAKTIFSYCLSRTASRQDAEDLSQSILCELMLCQDKLRSEEAFYGFMWGVAGNLYKSYLRKRAAGRFLPLSEELSSEEDLPCKYEQGEELGALRRELTLLSGQYRSAVVQYYLEEKSCRHIAEDLKISVEMVKYLLFKARKKLKEGICMQREYGEQSYHPKNLSLFYWGNGENHLFELCERKIPQNILIACYHDSCTVQEISLQTGVPAAYLEDELLPLVNAGLLSCTANHRSVQQNSYSTNMVITTVETDLEAARQLGSQVRSLAEMLGAGMDQLQPEFCGVGSSVASLSPNARRWQMFSWLLRLAVLEREEHGNQDLLGDGDQDYFVWGTEQGEMPNTFGVCEVQNLEGDQIRFLDFSRLGEMLHPQFWFHRDKASVFLSLAGGRRDQELSGMERELVAELVQKGFASQCDGVLRPCCPVYHPEEAKTLRELLKPLAEQVYQKVTALLPGIQKLLEEHTPVSLRGQVKRIGWMYLEQQLIALLVDEMLAEGKLEIGEQAGGLFSTYVLLH